MLEEIDEASQRAAQLYCAIYRSLEQRRVATAIPQEQLNQTFSNTLGPTGVGLLSVLEEFEEQVLPGCMTTPSPMYMGLVNSSPLPAGPLADLLISSLNNNGGTIHQNPSIAACENEVVRAFSDLVYGEEVAGMLLPGGTFANLQGLMLARSYHFPQWLEEGPHSLPGAPRIYVSDSTHFCVERAAHVLGLGRANIGVVPVSGRGIMKVDELRRMIGEDRAQGRCPFAVVGSLGTTGTGAIDPLEDLAELCIEEKLWFHVDGCYGGASLLVKEQPALAKADSVAVDPHKWFFVPMVAGLLLTRHGEMEAQIFGASSRSYIPGPSSAEPYLRGIPTSRRASALAVWMCLRAHGWGVVKEAVERNIRLTRLLEVKLAEKGLEVLPDGELSVACFRADGDNELQSRIASRVIETGKGWFATVEYQGRRWMRCNIVNLYTTEEHIDVMVGLISSATD